MESKKDTFGREKVIFIYEFFGTALFVYLINMCQGNLFAVPMFLFILGIIAGPISGALFNPAVAIGKFLVHEDPRKEALTLVVYLAAQFSGGLMGFFMSYSSVFNIEQTQGMPTSYPNEMLIVLAPSPLITTFGAFMTEVIGSALFVFMCIASGSASLAPTKQTITGGFGVGISMFGFLVVAQKSGSCLNPAFGLAQTVLQSTQAYEPLVRHSRFLWVYLFGPITGAVIASSAYKRHSKIFAMMTVPEPIEPVAVKVAYHDDEFRKAQ